MRYGEGLRVPTDERLLTSGYCYQEFPADRDENINKKKRLANGTVGCMVVTTEQDAEFLRPSPTEASKTPYSTAGLDSRRPSCLCLLSAGIACMNCYTGNTWST